MPSRNGAASDLDVYIERGKSQTPNAREVQPCQPRLKKPLPASARSMSDWDFWFRGCIAVGSRQLFSAFSNQRPMMTYRGLSPWRRVLQQYSLFLACSDLGCSRVRKVVMLQPPFSYAAERCALVASGQESRLLPCCSSARLPLALVLACFTCFGANICPRAARARYELLLLLFHLWLSERCSWPGCCPQVFRCFSLACCPCFPLRLLQGRDGRCAPQKVDLMDCRSPGLQGIALRPPLLRVSLGYRLR